MYSWKDTKNCADWKGRFIQRKDTTLISQNTQRDSVSFFFCFTDMLYNFWSLKLRENPRRKGIKLLVALNYLQCISVTLFIMRQNYLIFSLLHFLRKSYQTNIAQGLKNKHQKTNTRLFERFCGLCLRRFCYVISWICSPAFSITYNVKIVVITYNIIRLYFSGYVKQLRAIENLTMKIPGM